MNRLIKITGTTAAALTTALIFPVLVNAETAIKDVTVYAGPQSVSPDHPIYVTVEATDENGSSVSDAPAVLAYKMDGTAKAVTGNLENGLVSFQVPAQTKAGHMTFSATVSGVSSHQALVAVVAGPAQSFSLTSKPGEHIASVALSSKIITDKYGNPISDLSPVLIDWIDEAGLKSRQTVQLFNGRVLLTIQCPARFEGALKIKAVLGAMQFTSSKLNALCASGEG